MVSMIVEEPSLLEFIRPSLHQSFDTVHRRLSKWISRFSNYVDSSIANELLLVYLKAGKKYLDHRTPFHICRLVQAIYGIHKKLIQYMTLYESRWVEVRLLPTGLNFPFTSQTVMGCLIGFNILDRHELFDQENIKLVLHKHFPNLHFVSDSFYLHPCQNEKLCLLYFEVAKQESTTFSLDEQVTFKEELLEKIKNNIQKLTPVVFNHSNQEEIYKNLLILRKEIQSTVDLPQALIHLAEQTSDQISFLVSLVYVTPYPSFCLPALFLNHTYVQDQHISAGYCDSRSVEAQVFRVYLKRDISLLRSDGSWNFFAARQKIAQLITTSLGEFRDHNGGILLKQQELLQQLKEQFSGTVFKDSDLIENFFYAITPLDMQATLPTCTLFELFELYLANRQSPLTDYSFESRCNSEHNFFAIRSTYFSIREPFLSMIKEPTLNKYQIAYTVIKEKNNIFIQGVIFQRSQEDMSQVLRWIEDYLRAWYQKLKPQQLLRVGFDYEILSLDPRIGGDNLSQSILSLLFEGLTRINREGKVENGIAESINISSDGLIYTFRLRSCAWNTQVDLTAHDFVYAWKKILSPNFKTFFAYFFYPIKNSKAAKEGLIPIDQVGIEVVDDRTLRVYLEHPAPYFLQLTAHTIYSPIHRLVDQHRPQWPYQTEYSYPCNGPFCLKVHYPGQGYHLIKNKHYWDKSDERPDQIVFQRVTSHQGYEAFRSGTIDWLGHPLGSWAPFFSSSSEDHLISFPHESVAWLVLNVKQPLFSSLKIRQALAYAIDRDSLAEGDISSLQPAYSPLLPQHSCTPYARFPSRNVSLAQQLWQEGLEELGLSNYTIPRLNLIFFNKGMQESIATKIQAQLKEVLGLRCDLKALSWKEVVHHLLQESFQLGIAQWTSYIDDPIYTFNVFRYASAGVNTSRWEDAVYQTLLDQSDNAFDLTTRFKLLKEAENLLCKATPVIPLVYRSSQCMIKNRFQLDSYHIKSVFNFVKIKQK